MDLHSPLLAIAVIWFFAAVSPGPNFFITVRTSLTQSRTAAIQTVSGIATGTAIWALAGDLGIQTMFTVAPWSYIALKVIGGLYLCWMGAKLLRYNRSKSQQQSMGGDQTLSSWRAYRLGLATNIANPKTAVFVAGIFAATLHASAPVGEGVMAVLIMAAISMIWYSLVAVVVAQTRASQLYQSMSHWVDRVAGVVFLLFGVDLVLSEAI